MKRPVLIFLALVLAQFVLPAQTTKVRGCVIDVSNGKPVPFAAVYFSGTVTGTTTDDNGTFMLSTRDSLLTSLSVQLLGYHPVERTVRPGVYNDVIILLRPRKNELSGVTVKADDRLARKLLANIDAGRKKNNPEEREGYRCDVYSRIEIDLTKPREQLRGKALRKQWGFIFDYVDTSEISGIPYLPIMISESVGERLHSRNPDVDREKITASKLSGSASQDNVLSQFTGSIHLRNNFYEPFINAFNIQIPSPTNPSGMLYYNYYIVDTLQLDSRKTYVVHYHPRKNVSVPVFDGEMHVDAEEFALRKVRARLVRGQNVNWLRDMVVETEYERRPDSSWFYKSERFYADFSASVKDSVKMMSFIGNRMLKYMNPVYEKPSVDASTTVVTVAPDAGKKDDAYWDKARPYQLSTKEKNIYHMVDRIQQTKLYSNLYDVVQTIFTGYWEFDKVGVGPLLKLFSYNPLEGFRARVGTRTSVKLSRTDRYTAYLAYGVRDNEFKGGFTWEHLFSRKPTSKLTLDGHYDVTQLGRVKNKFLESNLLVSLLGGGTSQKLCPVTEFSALYEHEFSGRFNAAFNLMYNEIHGNSFVPLHTPAGQYVRSMPSAVAEMSFRWSRDETVFRGHFVKTYLHSDYPVFTLDIGGGSIFVPCFSQDGTAAATQCRLFLKPEFKMDWSIKMPPAGMSRIHASVGTIVGKVPYTYLHIHEGNGTYLYDRMSFSTMKFFEFASDSWVTLMWDHNFQGLLLGKIPGVKKLQLREALSLKACWGYLSDRNDGTRPEGYTPGQVTGGNAVMMFPEQMRSMGKVPFVEVGVGITNIFRLFRIDCIWRCTHRDDQYENPRNFVVNFGVELKF